MGAPTVGLGYLCQVQLARGAQFMAFAQIQMIAVRYSIVSVDFIPFLICCEVFARLYQDVTVHTCYL